MADSVEYNDERLRVIYDRMIEAGIDTSEVSRLMKPLKDEFERRVCGLVWSHKTATQKMIQDMGQRLPLLTPSLDESIIQDENGRDHILVEGDNLYLLMAMQYTHIRNGHGMVDVIYIDPPYNTGNVTFDYNDRFEKSEWLSMMDVRLRLARNVMADDGVIFISIDDANVAELKLLLTDIFGYNNFVSQLVIETGGLYGAKASHVDKTFVKVKDYVLVWSKDLSSVFDKTVLYDKAESPFDERYGFYVDDFGNKTSLMSFIKGNEELSSYFKKYGLNIIKKNISVLMQVDLDFYKLITEKYSGNIYKDSQFTLDFPSELLIKFDDCDVVNYKGYKLIKTRNGKLRHLQSFSDVLRKNADGVFYRSIPRGDLWKYFYKDMGNVAKEGGVDFRNGKKPVRLIRELVQWTNRPNAIVLDFFAGSGTTMQAVLELNAADGGYRQCILGTNNELGKDEVKQAKKLGYTEGSSQWESLGVCQRVTRKRMENVFPFHEHDNLRFYRISESEMVDSSIDDGGDITRMRMAQHAVPYISLREEAYADEAHDDELYHMLTSPLKHVMVVTDVNMLTTDIETLAEAQGIDGLVVYCPIRKSYDKGTVHYREYPREIIDALRHHQARARQVTR